MVNDVTALRGEPELAGVVADSGAYLCLMHMLGEPRTMQDDPRYDDVVSEVKAFLEERLEFATAAGIDEERICLDPGIGFGKTVEHNLELLARLDEIVALGRPVLVGGSRKRFLGGSSATRKRSRPRSGGAESPRGARLRARRDDLPRPRRARARGGARRGSRPRGRCAHESDGDRDRRARLVAFHGATAEEQEKPASVPLRRLARRPRRGRP